MRKSGAASRIRAAQSEDEKWRHLTVFNGFLKDGRFDSRFYMAKSGINS